MRFSETEMTAFKRRAGRNAVRVWMREALAAATGGETLTVETIKNWMEAHPELAPKILEAFGVTNKSE